MKSMVLLLCRERNARLSEVAASRSEEGVGETLREVIYGPVYPEVYDLFRDFKYNPIDDARFGLLEGTEDALTDDEKRVIDLVVNTFGMYGGKVLEKITHNEKPWMEARKGYEDSIPSSELLPKDRIMKYYILINQKYDYSGLQSQ